MTPKETQETTAGQSSQSAPDPPQEPDTLVTRVKGKHLRLPRLDFLLPEHLNTKTWVCLKQRSSTGPHRTPYTLRWAQGPRGTSNYPGKPDRCNVNCRYASYSLFGFSFVFTVLVYAHSMKVGNSIRRDPASMKYSLFVSVSCFGTASLCYTHILFVSILLYFVLTGEIWVSLFNLSIYL